MSTHEDGSFTYRYPHPAVATDIAIFTLREGRLAVLLIERGEEPFQGDWALPGGFLRPDEDLISCARRELCEEAGVEAPLLRQFGVFSAPDRDPRDRVISVAYLALLSSDRLKPQAGSDAADARWFAVADLPALAFDHRQIVEAALAALRSVAEATDILLDLMPARFTLTRLQAAYEIVTSQVADKRNFRARVLESGLLQETEDMERGPHRPARIYRRV